jgi:hypothetical protein
MIAQGIAGRNGKQCRARWMNQLCPSLNEDNWTPQEDMILVQQQRVYGNVWSQIAQFLPGRSRNAVKNRWSWLSRHSVPPVFVTRMFPFAIPQRPPPPRIVPQPRPVMPQIFQTQRTAPADLQWDPLALGRPPRCAFSDGADVPEEWQPSSDTDPSLQSLQLGIFQDIGFGFKEPEREFDGPDVGMRAFDDWSI